MRHRTIALLLALTATPLTAAADPPPAGKPIHMVIKGRPPRPLTVVDVSKPHATPPTPVAAPSNVDKVQAALDGSAF